MSKKVIATEHAPGAIGPYSQAILCGEFLFCSGQIPLDPKTGELVSGDIAAQTERVLANIDAVLQKAGAKWSQIVKTTIFLRNFDDFATVNKLYGAKFSQDPPARSTVEVSKLPKGAQIEIEVTAHMTRPL